MVDFNKLEGFDWDKGNSNKNFHAPNVSDGEAEEIFFNLPLKIAQDYRHSTNGETRFQALGITDENRLLSIVFTIRRSKIRVISARDMSRKERGIYYEQ